MSVIEEKVKEDRVPPGELNDSPKLDVVPSGPTAVLPGPVVPMMVSAKAVGAWASRAMARAGRRKGKRMMLIL